MAEANKEIEELRKTYNHNDKNPWFIERREQIKARTFNQIQILFEKEGIKNSQQKTDKDHGD